MAYRQTCIGFKIIDCCNFVVDNKVRREDATRVLQLDVQRHVLSEAHGPSALRNHRLPAVCRMKKDNVRSLVLFIFSEMQR